MENKKIRIDKYLAHMGIGSRSEVKKQIKHGAVLVNGFVVQDAGQQVWMNDEVVYLGQKVVYRKFLYLMMNKPQGVISATEDRYQHTVLDLLHEFDRRSGIFPAGRLDKDTEGLLLLTNDGKLAHNMLSPKKQIEKQYYVQVLGELSESEMELFQRGITLEDGYLCMPAHLEIIKRGEISEALITITEGKFHQVKRMVEAIGKKVSYLKRLSMGGLYLDPALKLGDYRELNEKEMEIIQQYQ